MKKKNLLWIKSFYLLFIPTIFLLACGKIIRTSYQDTLTHIKRAHKDIIKSYELDSPRIKSKLINRAFESLNKASTLLNNMDKKNTLAHADLNWHFAFFYLAQSKIEKSRDHLKIVNRIVSLRLEKLKEEENSEKKRDREEINNERKKIRSFLSKNDIIECRIYLKEANFPKIRENFNRLEDAVRNLPNSLLGYITLSDYQYLHGKLNKAKNTYLYVFRRDDSFRSLASDMLEVIEEIELLKPKPGFFPLMIWTKEIQREHLAFLLNLAIKSNNKVKRKLKRNKRLAKKFSDISSSKYKEAIGKVVSFGFFSYLKENKFSPKKIIAKEELAKIFSEFYAKVVRKTAYKRKYSREKKSPIFDIQKEHPQYNAIRLGLDRNIFSLALGRQFNPEFKVSGLEALVAINKMVKMVK